MNTHCQKNGCYNPLSGRQKSFCSLRCSKLQLKSNYKKRNLDKVQAYARAYRKLGIRHLTFKNRLKAIEELGSKCERCESIENLDLHHIKQLRLGGTNNKRNLLLLCEPCHQLWHKSFSQDYWDLTKSQ